MFTLIKREIDSIKIYVFVIAALTTAIIVPIVFQMISFADKPPIGIPVPLFHLFWLPLAILPFLSARVGSFQMYFDRNRKISSFLSTLPTTRCRLLIARILTGCACILLAIVPLILTDIILLTYYPRLIPIDLGLLVRMFVVAVLLNLAAYSLGLLLGWHPTRLIRYFAAIVLAAPLIAIVIVKGFGLQTSLLLILVTLAALTRTYQQYTETPL